MNRSGDKIPEPGHNKRLHAVVFIVAMLSIGSNNASAWTVDLAPSGYRISAAGDKFDDTWQVAMAFEIRPPRRLRARHLEFAIGSISTSNDSSAFLSLGPVWHIPLDRHAIFVELGISPTLILGSSTFNGRDLGGNFHFTSSFAIGTTFGRNDNVSVSLRAQHTSNAGLNSTNPGIDMIGIDFSFDFASR